MIDCCTLPDVCREQWDPFSEVLLSSVQDGIYVPRKAHMLSTPLSEVCPVLSLKQFCVVSVHSFSINKSNKSPHPHLVCFFKIIFKSKVMTLFFLPKFVFDVCMFCFMFKTDFVDFEEFCCFLTFCAE